VTGRAALVQSLALTLACLVSYWLTSSALARIHSLSDADDVLGGVWAVIATIFVYHASRTESLAAARARGAATAFSFALCFVYLLFLPFHPWGLAVLIGIGTFVLLAIRRPDDVITTGITSAVVMVAAALSPHDAWQQPLLRSADTAIGIAVALAASWIVASSETARSPAHS